jgi:hypothetical protein
MRSPALSIHVKLTPKSIPARPPRKCFANSSTVWQFLNKPTGETPPELSMIKGDPERFLICRIEGFNLVRELGGLALGLPLGPVSENSVPATRQASAMLVAYKPNPDTRPASFNTLLLPTALFTELDEADLRGGDGFVCHKSGGAEVVKGDETHKNGMASSTASCV